MEIGPEASHRFEVPAKREEVALLLPEDFMAIGRFYEDFRPVDDEQVGSLLRSFAPSGARR